MFFFNKTKTLKTQNLFQHTGKCMTTHHTKKEVNFKVKTLSHISRLSKNTLNTVVKKLQIFFFSYKH